MPSIAFSTLRKAAQASFYLRKSLKEKTPQAASLLNDYLQADTGFLKKIDQIRSPSNQSTKYSPFSEKELLTFLRKIWNEDPFSIISDLEDRKVEGSIAYLYFARLKNDSREVALKILKPEIEDEIYTLGRILKLLPEVSFLKKWNFPFASYKLELSERMASECDFNNEILNNKLAQSLKGSCPVEYPHIYLQLSNRQLLCMEKMSGKPLYFLVDELSKHQRTEIAKKLTETFFHQILKTGFFQSDWNPGNILYDLKTQNLQMIDFGSWIELTLLEQQALEKLISNDRMDSDTVKHLLVQLGFSESHLNKIENQLPRLIEILIAPIFHKSSIQLNQWNPSQKINDELGDLKWWFRSAGPAKGIFLIRAFNGFLSHLKALNIEVNFMQNFAVRPPNTFQTFEPPKQASLKAKQLHIELTDVNDKPIVNLNFPIHAIYSLKELMGDDICKKAEENQIDIDAHTSKFLNDGGPTGLFLKTETKDRRIRIWTT